MPVSSIRCAESRHFGRVERVAVPPVGVLAEDLKRLAPVDERAIHRLRHAARHRHVRADSKHQLSFSIVTRASWIAVGCLASIADRRRRRAGRAAGRCRPSTCSCSRSTTFTADSTRPPAAPAASATQDAGGIEYLATHLARLKATNPNTVVVSAGDNIGATPLLSSLFHDEPSIEALNLAGLQVSALGNHDLDEGWWELYRIQKGGCHPVDGCQDGTPFAGASFSYLAANVTLDPATGRPEHGWRSAGVQGTRPAAAASRVHRARRRWRPHRLHWPDPAGCAAGHHRRAVRGLDVSPGAGGGQRRRARPCASRACGRSSC